MKRKTKKIRCAIYTRKSTEEGLEQEFNSLDAQRESGEAYIASQKHEGWKCLSTRYDDGGFTGGNMERQALRRLLADISSGKIDCIVVYKVDRLSRSLTDFSKIMDVLDGHDVSFVSVTQQFNTSTSMGRLMLNVLLSFAQFERDIISERTRDKIAAARRKGKWVGGRPILGYDIASTSAGGRVTVNEDEAVMVRQIFELYLEHRSLIPTLRAIDSRGWRTKRWTTRKGQPHGGKPFTKESLHRLLTNVAYVGKVRYRDEVYEAEHAAIVSGTLFDRVQNVLRSNSRSAGTMVRNKHGALLKGLLTCGSCDCRMTHTYTSKGNKRYRYYVCANARKRGYENCPTRSVPAAEMERFVVERIAAIGKDDDILTRTMTHAQLQNKVNLKSLRTERRRLKRELGKLDAELRTLIGKGNGSTTERLADLQEYIHTAEQRAKDVDEQIATIKASVIDQDELAAALATFEPVWGSLSSVEQARTLQLLIERVTYNGADGSLAITFRSSGIKELEAVAC